MSAFDQKYWNLCQAVVWVEFRNRKLVEEYANAETDAYQALHFYPLMWEERKLEKVATLSDLLLRLVNGSLVAQGYRSDEQAKLQSIPPSQWHDIDLRPPRALDARAGHRGQELWTDVRVKQADMLRLWRTREETSGRTKYDWILLEKLFRRAAQRNPAFSKNDLIEEVQLEYKEIAKGEPPGRSTIQRRMKGWLKS